MLIVLSKTDTKVILNWASSDATTCQLPLPKLLPKPDLHTLRSKEAETYLSLDLEWLYQKGQKVSAWILIPWFIIGWNIYQIQGTEICILNYFNSNNSIKTRLWTTSLLKLFSKPPSNDNELHSNWKLSWFHLHMVYITVINHFAMP